MPLLDHFVASETSYFVQKEEMRTALIAYLNPRFTQLRCANISLHTLDRPGAGLAGMDLSVLGTSAEAGRGNQINGVIALNRPRGSEATAGKNPVSHLGKLYNVLSHLLAERIYREIPGSAQVVVWLCNRIGAPINEAQIAAVQVKLEPGANFSQIADPVRQLISRELERLPELCADLA